MGELIAVLQVMPTSPDIDLGALEGTVRAHIVAPVKCENVEVQPIAFGLKALNVTILAEDDGTGIVDKLEATLAELDDVESVRVTQAGRL